jgi:hypothetical protein
MILTFPLRLVNEHFIANVTFVVLVDVFLFLLVVFLVAFVQLSVLVRLERTQISIVECVLGSLEHILGPLFQIGGVKLVNDRRTLISPLKSKAIDF